MKRLIYVAVFGSILAMSTLFATQADAHWRGGRCCWGGGWIAPALIGGVVGYELSRPHYYEPAPVYIQQPPVYIQQPQIVQEPPVGYHWQMMTDPATNQQRPVLVPN